MFSSFAIPAFVMLDDGEIRFEDPDSDLELGSPAAQTPQSKTSSDDPKSGEKPKAKAVPKNGRHKADQTKKGHRFCKACQKNLPVQDFALNQVVCFGCKSALDVIAKKAKKQGKGDWFISVKQDPKALKMMMNNYKAAMNEAEKTGVKRNFWNLATYLEEIKASSETAATERGQMMWRDQAIEFWMSIQGGSMQKHEAEARWNNEATNYKEMGIASDQKGPGRAPLRLRVHTADLVDQTRRYTREKTLSCNIFHLQAQQLFHFLFMS